MPTRWLVPLFLLAAGCAAVDSSRRTTSEVTPPRIVHSPGVSALASGAPAHARVEATVRADGHATDVRMVEADDEGLAAALVRAVEASSFEPARRGGVAVDARMDVAVRRVPGGASNLPFTLVEPPSAR